MKAMRAAANVLSVRQLACGLIVSLFGLFGGARAATVTGLYDIVVPPTERAGQSSFDEAMKAVAVRISGQRSAGERLIAAKVNARGPLKQFSFKPDGSATIGFDASAFDKLLMGANLPIWGRERPLVLVWLALPDAGGRLVWQSQSDRSPEREALQRVATLRGLPLAWPAMDGADQANATALNGAGRTYAQLYASGDRYRADAVLFGVGARDASGGVTVRWSFAFNDEVGEVQNSLEEGVHFAADRCARVLAVAPGAKSVVPLALVGIRDLESYARAINYLEGVTLVFPGGVSVEQLRGDELDIRLAVHGDAATLRRTLALGRRLVEVKSPSQSGLDTDATVASSRMTFRLSQ